MRAIGLVFVVPLMLVLLAAMARASQREADADALRAGHTERTASV